MPFYIRNFNIYGFWYLQRYWNQSSKDNEGQLKFMGSQKLYRDFQLGERGQLGKEKAHLTPGYCSRVNCNLHNYVTGNSWFTYFEKYKSKGANQNLLLFPMFLVIFLFELKF